MDFESIALTTRPQLLWGEKVYLNYMEEANFEVQGFAFSIQAYHPNAPIAPLFWTHRPYFNKILTPFVWTMPLCWVPAWAHRSMPALWRWSDLLTNSEGIIPVGKQGIELLFFRRLWFKDLQCKYLPASALFTLLTCAFFCWSLNILPHQLSDHQSTGGSRDIIRNSLFKDLFTRAASITITRGSVSWSEQSGLDDRSVSTRF